MDFYDIIFIIIFLVVWFVLVTKIFPRFGVPTWTLPASYFSERNINDINTEQEINPEQSKDNKSDK